jgi:hypothetical protein
MGRGVRRVTIAVRAVRAAPRCARLFDRQCQRAGAFRTVATPTSLPNIGPLDTIYVFPDCPTCESVWEAAPGHGGYNGGRWQVVEAFGITSQLTNADAVVAAASSLVDTGTRFVCPLLGA